MKKAWLIIVCASALFLGLKFLIPKDKVSTFFDNKTGNQFEELLNEQLQDTLVQQRISDSLALIDKQRINALAEKEKRKIDSVQKVIQFKNVNRDGLQHFFEKLKALEHDKTKQVRIAFFGDSMEDGDMIVMQFRNYLQRQFGGEGVGYVPITSVTAPGRYSIKHSFSRGWKESNFMKKGYGRFLYGLNGKVFYTGQDSVEHKAVVTYRRGVAYKNLPLINPVLFYGKARKDSLYNATAYAVTNRLDTVLIDLKSNRLLNTYKLPSHHKRIKITIKDKRTMPFYGVSFASNNGIIVDNLATRGNSGLPLSKLNSTLIQQFDKHLKYDLVILAYGTNAFSFKNKKYKWYKSRMLKNVNHIQKCFPNADILVSSMGDRSMKVEGEMKTPEHLPSFINMQYSIAKESKSGFYNLYEQMGGLNSMVKWVEKDRLANKDYTHFNPEGAKKAGLLMYQWLMKHYRASNAQIHQEVKADSLNGNTY